MQLERKKQNKNVIIVSSYPIVKMWIIFIYFNKINLLISENSHLTQPQLLSPIFILLEGKKKVSCVEFKFRKFF